MATLQCQRCRFVAKNEQQLVRHWKTELQCPALYAKTPHQDLIETIKPKPTSEQRTCQYCQKECKSIAGMKIHMKSCLSKSQILNATSNDASTSQSVEAVEDNKNISNLNKPIVKNIDDLRKKKGKESLYADVATSTTLQSFTKEVDWQCINLDNNQIVELCRKKAEGIVDLFIILHNIERHDNIRWYYDRKHDLHKLIVYDGSKWVDINTKLITQHLWHLYLFLEENWCDYQSSIRCDAINEEQIIPLEERNKIEEFFYDDIVDEESVLFYCKDMFDEYIEAVKTI